MIVRSRIKNQRSKISGFTLVELLVSIGLFAVVTTVIITVLFTSFRASKKSEVIISIKQSGNAVLSRLVNGIRFARSLDDPLSCTPEISTNSITVTAFDNGQTTYSCPTDTDTSISSNSAALIDTTAVTVVGCSFSCYQSTTSDPPTIKIQFALHPSNETEFVESTSSILFQTAVIMRNFSQ